MQYIKLIRRGGGNHFLKQFPNDQAIWDDCKFTFDPHARQYDWLVVIDRLPFIKPETLACSPKNTIFVTTEPTDITCYGEGFVGQFAYLITSQDEIALPHRNAIRSQTGSHWFYEKKYSEIIQDNPYNKIKLMSAIATNKVETHTLHNKRFNFIRNLIKQVPEIDLLFSQRNLSNEFQTLFDNKAKFVEHKYDMVDNYKYHLVIGNQEGKHIWTERIADSFLGYSVPISFGCTNLSEYFPEDSFIEIDIHDLDRSVEKIRNIIYNKNDYNNRLKSVIEARNRVLNEYNLIPMITKVVKQHNPNNITEGVKRIYGRRVVRMTNLRDLVHFFRYKLANLLK